MGKFMNAVLVSVVGGVIVALIVAAFHIGSSSGGGSGPASPTPAGHVSTETGPAPTTPNAVPTGQCAFMYPTAVQCASSDPAIALDFDNAVSTVGCTFSVEISWGDGSSVQTVNIAGGPAGPEFVANHTYEQNGTFLISAEATTMSGACFTGPGTYSFTLSR